MRAVPVERLADLRRPVELELLLAVQDHAARAAQLVERQAGGTAGAHRPPVGHDERPRGGVGGAVARVAAGSSLIDAANARTGPCSITIVWLPSSVPSSSVSATSTP